MADTLKAPADPTPTERLASWLATKRREGEGIESATSRFRTKELRESQRAIRRQARGAAVPFVPLVDDGIPDWKWIRKNPDRRYRVRPWRRQDREPACYEIQCITAFRVDTKEGVRGIPADALHVVGVPAQPADSDDYAELILLVAKASRGFRTKRPGFAG